MTLSQGQNLASDLTHFALRRNPNLLTELISTLGKKYCVQTQPSGFSFLLFPRPPMLPVSSCSAGGLILCSSPEGRIKSVFIARNHSVQSLIVGAVAHHKLRLQVKDFQNTKLLSLL